MSHVILHCFFMNRPTSYTVDSRDFDMSSSETNKQTKKTENPTKAAYSFSGKNSFFICHVHIISFESQ